MTRLLLDRSPAPRGGSMSSRLIVVILTLVSIAAVPLRADVIDRIFAVIGSSLITQSDVTAAWRLGLQKPDPGAKDPVGFVLNKLIDRQLTLAEVERYAPPPPSDVDIDLRVQQVRLSFPSAEALQKALTETGMDEEQLRRYLRDDLRIAAYLEQRFGSGVQPSEEQILEYYTAHPERFTRSGVLQPFGEAHDAARDAWLADRRDSAVREWLEGLRRRGNVRVLYSGGLSKFPVASFQ